MFIPIDSIANPKIKYACKLASSAKFRKETGDFFLEGLRLCCEVSRCKIKVSAVFFTEKAYEKNKQQIEEIIEISDSCYQISQNVSDKLTQTENGQGIYCICKIPNTVSAKEIGGNKYIALDCIQNPDNLGAISRTAEALGINAMIVGGGCDIHNPKALRASMGSLLRLPIIKTDDLYGFLQSLKSKGFNIYATSPDRSCENITDADMSGSVVTVIGNEANGIRSEIFEICKKITIPMKGNAESFNAATAAAITMWEMMRSSC